MSEKSKEIDNELESEIKFFLQSKGFRNIQFNLNTASDSNFMTSHRGWIILNIQNQIEISRF